MMINSISYFYLILISNYYGLKWGLIFFFTYDLLEFIYKNKLDILWILLNYLSFIQIKIQKYIFNPLNNNFILPIKTFLYDKKTLIIIENGKEVNILTLKMFNDRIITNNFLINNYDISCDFIIFNTNNISNKYRFENDYNNFYKKNSIILCDNINDFIEIYNNYNFNNLTEIEKYYELFKEHFKTNVSFLVCNLIYNNNCYQIDINPFILYNNKILTYNFIKWYILNYTDIATNNNFNERDFFNNYKINIMDDNICEIIINNSNYILIKKNKYIICHTYDELIDEDTDDNSNICNNSDNDDNNSNICNYSDNNSNNSNNDSNSDIDSDSNNDSDSYSNKNYINNNDDNNTNFGLDILEHFYY